MIARQIYLNHEKSRPDNSRRHEIFSSLNCNIFLYPTFHSNGDLVREDLDLLDKVPDQLLIIGERFIFCLLDGFSQSCNPLFMSWQLFFARSSSTASANSRTTG